MSKRSKLFVSFILLYISKDMSNMSKVMHRWLNKC